MGCCLGSSTISSKASSHSSGVRGRTLLFAHASSSVNLSCRWRKSSSFRLPLCVLMSRRRRHPVEPCVLKSAQRGRLSTYSGRFLLFSLTSCTPGRIFFFIVPPVLDTSYYRVQGAPVLTGFVGCIQKV